MGLPATAPHTPSTLSGLQRAGGAPGPAPHKGLWIAVGLLGACVVALATTLVVQNLGPAPTAAPGTAMPVAQDAQPKQAPAQYSQAQTATNNVANRVPGPATPPAPAAPSAPAPLALQPVQAAAPMPVCGVCGRVESVQAVQQAAPATGVGAVAGGVLGAVVGNQVGKGSGRTAATVLGAVGGGYVGHKVEERSRTQTVYQIAVRMEDGSLRRFTRAQPTAEGTPVVLQGKGFRVDDGAAHRPAPPAMPATVRVADTARP